MVDYFADNKHTAIDFRSTMTQQLEAFLPYLTGNLLTTLIAIKGVLGPAELAGNAPFSGPDGLALDKAFGRLDWGYGSFDTRVWLGVVLSLPHHPVLTAKELRLICEVVDPLAIVALDDTAHNLLSAAFVSTEEGFLADFTPGAQTWVLGRHLVSVRGFEAALADEAAKQRAWAQLKRCTPPSPR